MINIFFAKNFQKHLHIWISVWNKEEPFPLDLLNNSVKEHTGYKMADEKKFWNQLMDIKCHIIKCQELRYQWMLECTLLGSVAFFLLLIYIFIIAK